MAEIAFAVVAATVSAVAVFLPLTFLTDETGRLFREFAVTVAAALAVSGFVAVTLSPALCALVLRPHRAEHGLKAALRALLRRGSPPSTIAGSRPVLRRPAVWVGARRRPWVVLGVMLLPTRRAGADPEIGSQHHVRLHPGARGQHDRVHGSLPGGRPSGCVRALPEVERVFSVIALGIGTPGLVNQGVLIASLSDPDQRERSQQQVVNDVAAPARGDPRHHRLSDEPFDDQRASAPRRCSS